MGCSSCTNNPNNTKNLGKQYFITACNIFIDFMRLILSGDSLIVKLNCYIVPTKSIPNFISLIKKYNILTDLENKNLENDDTLEYEIEHNIGIISDFSQCIKFIEENKDKDEEFILVNDKFLKAMKMNEEDSKKICANFDKERHIKEIIFDSNNSINIIEDNPGIYRFFPFDVSSVRGSNHIFNSNINAKLILNNNKLDNTFEKLQQADIVRNDSKIAQEINRLRLNSNLSNLVKNITESKSGLS